MDIFSALTETSLDAQILLLLFVLVLWIFLRPIVRFISRIVTFPMWIFSGPRQSLGSDFWCFDFKIDVETAPLAGPLNEEPQDAGHALANRLRDAMTSRGYTCGDIVEDNDAHEFHADRSDENLHIGSSVDTKTGSSQSTESQGFVFVYVWDMRDWRDRLTFANRPPKIEDTEGIALIRDTLEKTPGFLDVDVSEFEKELFV